MMLTQASQDFHGEAGHKKTPFRNVERLAGSKKNVPKRDNFHRHFHGDFVCTCLSWDPIF